MPSLTTLLVPVESGSQLDAVANFIVRSGGVLRKLVMLGYGIEEALHRGGEERVPGLPIAVDSEWMYTREYRDCKERWYGESPHDTCLSV